VTPPHKQLVNPEMLAARPPDVVAAWEHLQTIAQPVAGVRRANPAELESVVVQLCRVVPLHRRELTALIARSPQTVDRTTTRLVKQGRLRHLLEPASHPDQRYLATQLIMTGVR